MSDGDFPELRRPLVGAVAFAGLVLFGLLLWSAGRDGLPTLLLAQTGPAGSFWLAVERLSWAIALVGLPLAIVSAVAALGQLRHVRYEQERIAAELTRRPELVVGFPPSQNAGGTELVLSTTITPTWPEGGVSATTEILIATFNRGTRTARNLLLNYALPPGFSSPETSQHGFPASGYTREAAILPNGWLRFIRGIPHLHPGALHLDRLGVEVPRGVSQFAITAVLVIDDAEPQRIVLQVDVTTET